MQVFKARAVAGVAACSLALTGSLGFELVHGYERARSTLLHNFAGRTLFAARTTSTIVHGSLTQTQKTMREEFDGPRRGLGRAVAHWESLGPTSDHLLILSGKGEVILSWPRPSGGLSSVLRRNPLIRDALAGRPTMSDLITGRGGRKLIETAIPIATSYGRRVVVDSASADIP